MARLDTFEAVATELEARRSFLIEAGAGAGKTTTLVRTLQHLLNHHRTDLEAHGRRIACITEEGPRRVPCPVVRHQDPVLIPAGRPHSTQAVGRRCRGGGGLVGRRTGNGSRARYHRRRCVSRPVRALPSG
ncbi:UvrD-helicase domain-containing protein [Streptomyces sp. MS1.AVA.3]|uniref:UvrD-helicase domain-containing protein n=1 Tax=Streptomyces decoyicus TaxID=249567 RepID=UPI0030BC3006